jgi:membrane protein YfhO
MNKNKTLWVLFSILAVICFIVFKQSLLLKKAGAETKEATIFKNKYEPVLGSTYHQYIRESNFDHATFQQKRFITTHAFVVNDKDVPQVARLEEYKLTDISRDSLNSDTSEQLLNNLRSDTLYDVVIYKEGCSGYVNLSEDKLLYFPIPYDKKWLFVVDITELKPVNVNNGMMGIFLEKGKHHIELEYKLRYIQPVLIICIISLIILFGVIVINGLKKGYINKHKESFIVLGILSILSFIVFKRYLTFEYAYYFYDICSDGYYGGYPQLSNQANLFNSGIPSWSFKLGMGQNVFPFMWRDPFAIILYLTGAKNIIYATVYAEVAKVIFSGFVFYHFLRLLKLSFFTSLIGCILYAFSGFMIEGSAWFSFSAEAFNFALFLLAFESLFISKKWVLFPVAVFLICISMPFNLYLYGLFIFFYAIFRHLQSGKFDFGKLFGLLLKMGALTLLGIVLAGPFLLQNIWLLLHMPRGAAAVSLVSEFSKLSFFSISDRQQLGSAIFRFFSTDILGSGSNFKGWDTIIGSPLFYVGLICLLTFPQIFVFLNKKLRILFFVSILVWLLPTVFPFMRRALWLFAGDYYRGYSVFVAFLVLFYAVNALENIVQTRKVNLILLAVTLLILLGLLYFPPFIPDSDIDKPIRNFAAIMLTLYSIILTLFNKQLIAGPFTTIATNEHGESNKLKGNLTFEISLSRLNYLKYALFILIFVEVCYLSGITANRRDAFGMSFINNAKIIYNSYQLDAINYIHKTDKSFFRVDENFIIPSARWTALNNGQAMGFNGTSSYNSFNQLYYIRYLQQMGVVDKTNESESRWAIGLIDNPILESENNVKYFFSEIDYKPVWHEMWDSIATIGEVKIYQNKFMLPFGFTYDHYIKESDFNYASAPQKKFITLRAFVVSDRDVNHAEGLKEFSLTDTVKGELNFDTFSKEWSNLHKDSISISNFEDTKISGTITLDEDKLVYLSIPYDDGWHIMVDGSEHEKIIVNGGMTGVFVKKGQHKIEMNYRLKFMLTGTIMSILAIFILLFGHSAYFKRKKIRKNQTKPG